MKGASPETDVVKWTFKDGTVLDIKQEEHSVCEIIQLKDSQPFWGLNLRALLSPSYLK